jgi:hypothetical protein
MSEAAVTAPERGRLARWRHAPFGAASDEPFRRRSSDVARVVVAVLALALLVSHADHPTRTEQTLFEFFNSRPMLEFLEGLTTIRGLIPDPYFIGGGFHETGRGGKLGIHADFRINEQLHLHRRLNVIVYLNEEWKPEWGGALELWDRDMKSKVREVMPVFNRCVVFNTDADSFHGHPDPLETPEGVLRRSIALYYYTASKEIYNEVPSTSTMYHARPGDDATVRREARRLRFDQHVRQWVPPALQRYVWAVRRRLSR